jgi:hypothetical protein
VEGAEEAALAAAEELPLLQLEEVMECIKLKKASCDCDN